MRYRWRGPQPAKCEEQIANAPDGSVDLSPASDSPAETVRSAWAAVLPSEVPFIWEASHGDRLTEEDRCDEARF